MNPLRCAATAVAAVVPWVTAGCTSNSEREFTITEVLPARAYSSASVSLTVIGAAFRPAYQIESMAGSAGVVPGAYAARLLGPNGAPDRVAATRVTWQGTGLLVADFARGLRAGSYDLELTDPRGHTLVHPASFLSLGPDAAPAVVTIVSPSDGSLLGAETAVTGILLAHDGDGYLKRLVWTLSGPGGRLASGACAVPAGAHATSCTFSFVTPQPAGAIDDLTLVVDAGDAAENPTSVQAALRLAPRPVVTSFVPRTGPAGGGTSLAIQGDNFVDGNPGTEILIDGVAIPTTFTSTTLLQGRTPPHDPGDGMLAVRNGGAVTPVGRFSFFAAPIVRVISPAIGSAAGGTPVTIAGNNFRGLTQIVFGEMRAPLACARVISDTRIEGLAPAGSGVVTVIGTDHIGGDGTIGAEFTFSDAIDGGLPPANTCPGADGGGPP